MVNLVIMALGSLVRISTPTSGTPLEEDPDYSRYHQRIDRAEQALAQEMYDEALGIYKEIFQDYEFVFLRDLKVGAQLACHLDREQEALSMLQSALASGWTLKAARKNELLSQSLGKNQWRVLVDAEDSLRGIYEQRIDAPLRDEIHQMYIRDQRKALGAFLKLSEKGRNRFSLEKFAPQSEAQMHQLLGILKGDRYPGERTIGNNYWVSTVVSHHNSISLDYNQKDTLYADVRPMLLEALKRGEMSPYELALMDDWRIAVVSNRQGVGYGFLNSPTRSTLSETDAKRQAIGLRTVALRNQLVYIQAKTGMDFDLPDWVDGAIEVREE